MSYIRPETLDALALRVDYPGVKDAFTEAAIHIRHLQEENNRLTTDMLGLVNTFKNGTINSALLVTAIESQLRGRQ